MEHFAISRNATSAVVVAENECKFVRVLFTLSAAGIKAAEKYRFRSMKTEQYKREVTAKTKKERKEISYSDGRQLIAFW